jgi:hypothetical protein
MYIVPVNDPPIPEDAEFELLEDGQLVGPLNAVDPDGDEMTFYLACPPVKGTVSLLNQDGQAAVFNYSAFPDASGPDSFVFVVSDGQAEAAGMIRLFITPTDDPPIAEDLTVTVYSGVNTSITLPAYDPDGDPVELFIVTEPPGGAEALSLAYETSVGGSSSRRKGRNPVAFFAPADPVPDFTRSFRSLSHSSLCL